MYIVTFTNNGAPVCHWDWRIDAAPDASAAARAARNAGVAA